MLPLAPKTHHVYRRHAPTKAPCPPCGTPGHRKDVLQRTVRGSAVGAIVLVQVTTAAYCARCACWKTFRTQVEGIAPKAP
jgi:hypothetical protein